MLYILKESLYLHVHYVHPNRLGFFVFMRSVELTLPARVALDPSSILSRSSNVGQLRDQLISCTDPPEQLYDRPNPDKYMYMYEFLSVGSTTIYNVHVL